LKPKEEVEDIKFTPDYEDKEPIFQRIFQELSNEGNGLVDYYNLQRQFGAAMFRRSISLPNITYERKLL
jgi:hypothetical protein